jgi:hypothetical protein
MAISGSIAADSAGIEPAGSLRQDWEGDGGAEDVPAEEWIVLAKHYRQFGTCPSTLGPPAGNPGSSRPPELASEAS